MIGIEDNPKNPTILTGCKINSPNVFLIKYQTDEERKNMAKLVTKLVLKHEITDFHIQEKEAFTQTKLLYNEHTLFTQADFSFEELDTMFLKFYLK